MIDWAVVTQTNGVAEALYASTNAWILPTRSGTPRNEPRASARWLSRPRDMRALLWAGLQRRHPMTVGEAGDLLGEILRAGADATAALGQQLTEGIAAAFPPPAASPATPATPTGKRSTRRPSKPASTPAAPGA